MNNHNNLFTSNEKKQLLRRLKRNSIHIRLLNGKTYPIGTWIKKLSYTPHQLKPREIPLLKKNINQSPLKPMKSDES